MQRIEKVNSEDELVALIEAQNFEGNDMEVAIQQILFLDQYIKQNVQYDFEGFYHSVDLKNEFQNAQTQEEKDAILSELREMKDSFSKKGFYEGKTLCGGISEACKDVLNRLWEEKNLKCGYIYGSYGGEEGNHRANTFNYNGSTYIFDYTINMLASHYGMEDEDVYQEAIEEMKINQPNSDFEYIFSNKLLESQSWGGIVRNNAGVEILNKPIFDTSEKLSERYDTIDNQVLDDLLKKVENKYQSFLDNQKKEEELEKMFSDENIIENSDYYIR